MTQGVAGEAGAPPGLPPHRAGESATGIPQGRCPEGRREGPEKEGLSEWRQVTRSLGSLPGIGPVEHGMTSIELTWESCGGRMALTPPEGGARTAAFQKGDGESLHC